MKYPVTLSNEFSGILDQLEYTGDHLFITGRAGTGKSTLLQVFRTTTKKKVVVLAPTGIAALNVKGQTIHSFFGFPPRLLNRNEIERRKNYRLYVNLDMIINAFSLPAELQAIAIGVNGEMLSILTAGATGSF